MKNLDLIDFKESGETASWQVVNDDVMGGVSRGELRLTEDATLVFCGTVSLENNGGFTSVRTVPGGYDFTGFDGVVLRVMGDGKRYRFRLRTDDRVDGIAYQAAFDTRPDVWETIRLPFSEFMATFRGRRVIDAPPLDLGRVRRVGFLIADKQAGAFRLEVDRIGAYAIDP